MRLNLTIRAGIGDDRDVQLQVADGTTVGEVQAELLGCTADAKVQLWSGARRLPAAALVGGPGLRTGAVIGTTAPSESEPTAAALRVHVVGGPDAGRVVALPRGLLVVGRAPGCDLELSDPDVSRHHLAISVTRTAITVRDLGSTNGSRLENQQLEDEGSALAPEAYLRVGNSTLSVSGVSDPGAALRAGADGLRIVNRPPRLAGAPAAGEVTLPEHPPVGSAQRVQWLAALVPAVVGGGLALMMHNAMFLAFTVLSPVMMIAAALGDRVHWRRRRRQAAGSFARAERLATQQRSARLAQELALRRRAHPDPAAVLRTASTPDCRLWERRRQDHDHLDVRLGLAEHSSRLVARRGSQCEPAGRLYSVPSTLNLRDGALGVAGPRAVALGLARWVLGQLAVLQSPADLELALLLSDDCAPAWTWARWLPHLADRIAETAERRQAMVSRLLAVVDERQAGRGSDQPASWAGCWTVLVVDRTGALADLAGLARLLQDGPSVGITAICLDEDQRRLPTACVAVASIRGDLGAHLHVARAGAAPLPNTIADRVGSPWADTVARALASLVDAGSEAATSIPTSSRLLAVLDLETPTPAAVIAGWARGGRPVATLGIGVDGPLEIDLDHDGPHALVAGTTGAGKSELLQSLIAALAVNNSPADLSFVLIDYKGGAAFADCARLPHTAGLVTDLDPHLTERALRSLGAELTRREALFAAAGAKDLTTYQRGRPGSEPVGRLVLVVDEFAALAEELPQFVNGLISIAQRGRSLGIHLVLATQRPGGVISPEIRANTSLRIALRVTDPGESLDVINTAAAADIDKSMPGRAWVRTGSALVQIQTARIGGPTPSQSVGPLVTSLDGWGRTRAFGAEAGGKTDLMLLVDSMREAAHCSGAAPARRPWLAPLPARIALGELSAHHRADSPGFSGAAAIAIGLADRPDEQQQSLVTVDLAAGGPLLIAGTARSGRTTILRTLAAHAASTLSPQDLQLYAIDCGGGALMGLTELAHCGGVVARDQPGRIDRMLTRLSAEVARRQMLLTQLGANTLRDAGRSGHPLPYLLLLLDGWENFVAAAEDYDGGRSVDALQALLRDAASAGLTIAIAGDRSTLSARLANSIATKFVLRLADPGDYALAGISPRDVPAIMPPGRGLAVADGHEVQFAFLGPEPAAAAQWAAVAEIAGAQSGRFRPSLQIRALPNRVSFEDAQFAAAAGRQPPDAAEPAPPGGAEPSAHDYPARTLLGIGGDAAEPIDVDLFAGDGHWLVAGPPRSGRSTVLISILNQSLRTGEEIVIAAPRRSARAVAASAIGFAVISPSADSHAVKHLVEMEARRDVTRRRLLIVDDTESFLESEVSPWLCAVAQSAGDGTTAVVVAGRSEDLALTYRGIAAVVRRSRTGILLQPAAGDGELLGIRLPRTRPPTQAGRGILVCDQPHLGDLTGSAEQYSPIAIQLALAGTSAMPEPTPRKAAEAIKTWTENDDQAHHVAERCQTPGPPRD